MHGYVDNRDNGRSPDAPSETLGFVLADLENALAIAKIGRPWLQRTAIMDSEIALSRMRGLLVREGVIDGA